MKNNSFLLSYRLFKGVLFIACSVFAQSAAYSQWAPAGATGNANIYNTNTTGKVGIGTINPQAKLHLFDVSPTLLIGNNQLNNTLVNAPVGSLEFHSSYNYLWKAKIQGFVGNYSDDVGLRFQTSFQNTVTTAMAITGKGFVGIGTIDPKAKLHIIGDINVGDNLQTSIISGNGFSGAIQIKTNVGIGGIDTRYLRLGIIDNNKTFYSVLSIGDDSNVGIGTTDTKGYKLGVNGSAIATSMTVKLYGNWPDFVFAKTHRLRPLSEVESYIQANQHLPEVPSAAEVAKAGINLGEMDAVLLKKIEELTLYMIEMKKENEEQSKEIQALKVQVAQPNK